MADPSVYVRFPLVDEPDTDTSLLVWTTTPWTLPSNQFAAVHPELEYSSCVEDAEATQADRRLGAGRNDRRQGRQEVQGRVDTFAGQQTARAGAIVPPFDYYYKTLGEKQGRLKLAAAKQHVAWRVVPADFVTIDSGTGVVHQAPAFGEVDFDVLAGRASAVSSTAKGPS